MLIALANLVNLLLTRADTRGREMAIRAALGADRARIVRQLLVEHVVLAVGGGLVGLGLAWASLRVLSTQHPTGLPRLADVSLDPSVLALTAGLSVLAGLVFGLAPAVRFSRPALVAALRDGSGATAGATRHLLRRGFVIVQIASPSSW